MSLWTSPCYDLCVQGEESGFRDLSSHWPCQPTPMENQKDPLEGMPLQTLIFLRGTEGQPSLPSFHYVS